VRAVLVVNPTATATNPRVRDVLVRALGSELKLEVIATERRGHAVELARRARADGVDVVVTLGGDGTVNEAVNGLLAPGPAPRGPALLPVPGGSANVFARTLGLPRDPVEATGELLAALRDGRRRRIGLGRVADRWFTFCAGVGLDAEVVRAVEGHRGDAGASPALYVGSALRHFFVGTDRRHPALTLERPASPPVPGLFLAIVSNSSPWTYLGATPVLPNPEASFATGLDLLAMRRLRVVGTLRVVRRMLVPAGGPPRGRGVLRAHDLATFTLTATRPMALQVDGDYVGEAERFVFASVPDALTVIA
jgi:diacylglycerol kinase family enzyme